ncbi:hypothetical protein KPL74_15450 [Bacillus sp. NP157]|nr:hypothetical protein KPL74_15450 [Bacillus sp. NP157]
MFEARKNPVHARPFAAWRIVVWLVMLLAAMGFVINGYASVIIGQALFAMTDAAAADARPGVALAWSIGYAVAAFATMAIALATLRWRDRARQAMRVIAVPLALWAAWTAWIAFGQWQQLGVVLGQAGLPPDLLMAGIKHRNILLVGVVLKAVSVPVLAWLAWILGRPRVREQFGALAL